MSEAAVEKAMEVFGLTRLFTCHYYVNLRVDRTLADIEATDLEAAAAKAYEHVLDHNALDDDDLCEMHNLSIYVSDPDEEGYDNERNIDGRSAGEPWLYQAHEIINELAVAETDEERQRLVRKARDALIIDRAPTEV